MSARGQVKKSIQLQVEQCKEGEIIIPGSVCEDTWLGIHNLDGKEWSLG